MTIPPLYIFIACFLLPTAGCVIGWFIRGQHDEGIIRAEREAAGQAGFDQGVSVGLNISRN